MKYTIDCDSFSEGGSAEFYHIKESKTIGFKQFASKKYANRAYNRQKLLSKYNLAPRVIGVVCKITYKLPIHEALPGQFYSFKTNWGFITEKAKILDEKVMKKRLKEIQSLVNNIQKKAHLKFWDCHYWNVGYVRRNNRAKLVCIDTGNESFNRDCDAWGNGTPGPKCMYCTKYSCSC